MSRQLSESGWAELELRSPEESGYHCTGNTGDEHRKYLHEFKKQAVKTQIPLKEIHLKHQYLF